MRVKFPKIRKLANAKFLRTWGYRAKTSIGGTTRYNNKRGEI
jgi:hypothetical protein